MVYKVISFYRYVVLDIPESIRKEILQKCQELEILGRILVGEEGINGAVCGEEKSITLFQEYLENYFPALTYREQNLEYQAYHKLVVRVRKEIVAFGKKVDRGYLGKHISPQQLKEWYDTKKDFVIIDARNEHEAVIGRFKDAVVLPIKIFKEFPDGIEKMKHLKDKEVVMYCTGGIRCEKASAYMKEQGFSFVHQLEGGIINYMNQYPETYYEGACFMFDDRLSVYTDMPISSCALCGESCAEYTNCFNLDCDDLFVSCASCREKMHNTCSMECLMAPRQRIAKKKVQLPILGVVENYYAHAKVALVHLEGDISRNFSVLFQGATTKNVQEKIVELRDYDGNALDKGYRGMRVTFPVKEKVRVCDTMVLLENV